MSLSWDGRTVLVTGAQGFVGSWLTERLLDEGARVVALRRDVEPGSRFRSEAIEDRCVIAQADLVDYEAMMRVLNEHDVTAVFHLAAQTIVGTANRAPLSTFDTNMGHVSALGGMPSRRGGGTGARRRGRGLVRQGLRLPRAVALPRGLPPPGGLSLRRVEGVHGHARALLCRDVRVAGGGHSAGQRVRGRGRELVRVVPDTARALAAGERPVIRSDGTPERDYMYVSDAVEAYLAVAASLEHETWPGVRGMPGVASR